MLLLAALAASETARAAPLAPTGLGTAPNSTPGVEVSAYTGVERAWLRESACSGAACDALRVDLVTGAEVGVALAPPIGLYAHAAYVSEEMDAALYAAPGYAAGGGLRLTLPLRPLLAVHAWAGVEHQLTATEDLSERVSSWALDGGATLRGGDAANGFVGWIGLGVVPWSSTPAVVLDGDVTLALDARIPVEGVAGVMLVSEPLFGPWNDRTRLGAGVSASAGDRTGLTGVVSVLH